MVRACGGGGRLCVLVWLASMLASHIYKYISIRIHINGGWQQKGLDSDADNADMSATAKLDHHDTSMHAPETMHACTLCDRSA